MSGKTDRGRSKSNSRAKKQNVGRQYKTKATTSVRKRVQPNKVKKKKRTKGIFIFLFVILLLAGVSYIYSNYTEETRVVKKYFDLLDSKQYEEMYDLVECDISKEDFTNRIKNIYEGIEADNISINILTNMIINNIKNRLEEKNDLNISYKFSMNTIAGDVNYIGTAPIIKTENGYKIKWSSALIFKNLNENEKVRVRTINCKRGSIYDRNGKVLAKDSSIYEIGIVPSKFENQSIKKVADLLGLNSNELKREIENSSNDYIFVKKISKEEQDVKNELLKINGILIGDSEARVYPYKEIASSIIGYVIDGEGKTGLEESFDNELKGNKGAEIYIETDGKIKEILAKKESNEGNDIKTTIDVDIQKKIYEEFEDDSGLAVSLNYNTGEVLALVSLPSYDANKFVLGLSNEEWRKIQNDKNNPLFNKCLSTYSPGSTIKPIMAVLGIENDVIDSLEEDDRSIRKWQKDTSWKDFYITTLELYNEPVNLENALVYSDNIYFAKLALKLGKDKIESGLDELGFNEEFEFEQKIKQSTYGELDNEKTIATTGFGQANVMVNPVLISSIYSAFANGGNMVKPYLKYEESEDNKIKYYKENIISEEVSHSIKEYLVEVVKRGSGKKCYMEDKVIAGKTGTAEIKKDQKDKSGTENGWFNSFDEYGNLYVCMIENVKNKGGSTYVVEKMRKIYE